MKIEQRITVAVRKATLEEFLRDFPRVARCIPGMEHLEQVGEESYQGTMRVRLGPMGFQFTGTFQVSPPFQSGPWKMEGEAHDRRLGSGARATVQATLKEQGVHATEFQILANVQFMGRLGTMGQPLIKRKIESLFREFTENLNTTTSGTTG